MRVVNFRRQKIFIHFIVCVERIPRSSRSSYVILYATTLSDRMSEYDLRTFDIFKYNVCARLFVST